MKKSLCKKHKRMFVLLSIFGAVVICAVAVLLMMKHSSTPTRGEQIAEYENPNSALVVLHLQNDVTNWTSRYGDTREFIDSVNQAIASAEEDGMEIIYIRQIQRNPIFWLGTGGRLRAGTEGVELDDSLKLVNDNIFDKHISDAFSSREFEEFLIASEVDTLYLVGADARGCVYITAQGGLNRGYNVNVIEEAIITISDAELKRMLNQYVSSDIGVVSLRQFEGLINNTLAN
jgi:nicotinamidase-related amidase